MSKRDTSRREFLQGNVVPSDSLADGQTSVAGKSNIQQSYLEHYSKNAMACEFAVFLNMHQYPGGADAVLQAFQLIDDLEQQLSIYRDDSEVSRLNRDANESSQSVEHGLFELLQTAAAIHGRTKGAFDITSSALSDLWGFTRREGRVPNQSEIDSALESVSAKNVDLSEQGQLRLAAGTRINLGGIGKGYALDRATVSLVEKGINDFVIHGGQSSVVARGSESHASKPATAEKDSNPKTGWPIGLSHPAHPGTRLAEIYLSDEALGTSGTGRQGFFHQGRRYGHIIDPRTGWPTDHCLSTTVITESAAECDALATAFFVMQPDEVADYCEQHPHVKAILVLPECRSGKIEIVSHNLPPDQWRML